MRLDAWAKQESQKKKADELRKKEEAKEKQLLEQRLREEKAQDALKKKHEFYIPPGLEELVTLCPRLSDSFVIPSYMMGPGYPLPGVLTGAAKACQRLMQYRTSFIRPLKDWKPQGKSFQSLFRSLASHCLSKYSMPPFLWSAFLLEEEAVSSVCSVVVVHIALGGSLKAYLKNPDMHNFPVPLTSKMIHDFMRSPATYGFMRALRSSQVKNLGGDNRLCDALMNGSWGKEIGSRPSEAFWASVVQWFSQQALLDPSQVPQMCDFIGHKYVTEPGYSMKGRTAMTVIRGMLEWHQQLAHMTPDSRYKGKLVFEASGYKELYLDLSNPDANPPKVEIWRTKEILTAKELYDEGRRQGHCVASYAHSIENKRISIWTLTKEDEKGNWAMLTMELVSSTGAIVQARGRFNRPATPMEQQMMNRWTTIYKGG